MIATSHAAPSTHTLQPVSATVLGYRSAGVASISDSRAHPGPPVLLSCQVVTGSSVLGVKCSDGVVMASDTLGSYGSMARYRDLRRMVQVTDELVIGAGGEYSDFQAIIEMLEEIT